MPYRLVLVLASIACDVSAAGIPVFVTIPPQKYFVEQVGGARVEVSMMVGRGQSEETYEPTPKQLASLAQARVYFRIGVPFEDTWMRRFAAVNPKMRIIDCRQGITPLYFSQGEVDPHIWTDPGRVRIMARGIRDSLAALDPDHGAAYAKNFRLFEAKLRGLDEEIRAMLEYVPVRKFLVFHPSWGYFAHAYGLEQIPIERDGKEPGAKALAELTVRARAGRVRMVFVDKRVGRQAAEAIAREIGAEVRQFDALAEDYINNIRSMAREFGDPAA